jgi:hypothetical protein
VSTGRALYSHRSLSATRLDGWRGCQLTSVARRESGHTPRAGPTGANRPGTLPLIRQLFSNLYITAAAVEKIMKIPFVNGVLLPRPMTLEHTPGAIPRQKLILKQGQAYCLPHTHASESFA